MMHEMKVSHAIEFHIHLRIMEHDLRERWR